MRKGWLRLIACLCLDSSQHIASTSPLLENHPEFCLSGGKPTETHSHKQVQRLARSCQSGRGQQSTAPFSGQSWDSAGVQHRTLYSWDTKSWANTAPALPALPCTGGSAVLSPRLRAQGVPAGPRCQALALKLMSCLTPTHKTSLRTL